MLEKFRNKNLFIGATGSGVAFTLMFLLYVIVSSLGGAILSACVTEKTFLYYAISSLFSIVSIFIIILVYRFKTKSKILQLVNIKKFDIIYILIAILLGISLMFTFGKFNEVFSSFLQDLGLKINLVSINPQNTFEFIYYTISICVLPAIFEECLFRGIILGGLNKINGVISSLIVAFLFALYHANISQFIYQFIYGFCLSLLVIKSASILPAILVHFLNNFIILLFTFINVNLSGFLSNIFVIISGAVLFIIIMIFLLLFKKNGQENIILKKCENQNAEIKDVFLFSSLGIIFSLSIIVLGML